MSREDERQKTHGDYWNVTTAAWLLIEAAPPAIPSFPLFFFPSTGSVSYCWRRRFNQQPGRRRHVPIIAMRLLPLVLSAHASGFNPGSGFGPPENGTGSRSCQFCGLEAAGWQERFHLNGDHDDERSANIVSACVLCYLCQHLERWSIDQEAILIWLPELTQGAVIALARDAHRRLAAHGRISLFGAAAHEFSMAMFLRRGTPSWR